MNNPDMLSPSVLAFVGDAVYTLYVRTALSDVNRPSRELHRMSVKLVNASAQAEAYRMIADLLTEEEKNVFKRGRNFHTNSKPSGATGSDYHIATGLETLFGYLYLSGQTSRSLELFEVVWKKFSDS